MPTTYRCKMCGATYQAMDGVLQRTDSGPKACFTGVIDLPTADELIKMDLMEASNGPASGDDR